LCPACCEIHHLCCRIIWWIIRFQIETKAGASGMKFIKAMILLGAVSSIAGMAFLQFFVLLANALFAQQA
jgi:hypothetical protein